MAVLEYHCCYGMDPFTVPDSYGRLVDYYGIRLIPTAKINGRRECVGDGVSGAFTCYQDAYNSEMSSYSPCTLRVDVLYDSTTRELKVTTWVTNLYGMSYPHLRYAIAESHIYHPWQFLDSLHHVVRKMLPNYDGVFFGVPVGETFVDSQSCTLDPGWNDRNCYVVVFVQSDYTPYPVYRSATARLFPSYVFGDATGDGIVDIGDTVFLLNYLWRGGESPNPYGRGDPNRDCIIDAADIVYLVNYLYRSGSAPLKGCD